jgi:hypothetical protein
MHGVGCLWPGVIVQQYGSSSRFPDMMLAPFTTTSWQRISAGDVPFSCRNLITLHTSMCDHVSASPVILQLMMGQYD